MELMTDIYPKELQLNNESKNDKECNYLDMNITINNNILTYKLYDKKDNFSFEIVNYPNLSGNLPKNHSYGIVVGQLLRYTLNCKYWDDFISRVEILFNKLIKNHYNKL